jgi:hypothetical protein
VFPSKWPVLPPAFLYAARHMIKVGGEVDALCNKCELTLAHTVIAMVGDKPAKVKCNTCKGEHKYRPVAGPITLAGSVAKKKAARAPREKKVYASTRST